ncbi:MAG: hypothetical protein WCA39_13500 [Nitrososphaeraceae archaeon]
MGFPALNLLFILVVFVMMIFVLIVIVAGAALYAQTISGTTATATPHVTIAFVGNTSPIASIDHVSVAGIITYNAASSSRNTEQKILTVFWGDGTSNQSKITRISSSSESKWGPLYHKYDSETASNPYAIVATLDVLSSSSSNKGIGQIKSEPYLINVQKGPITGYSSDSLRTNTDNLTKNNELLFSPISHLGNIIALSIIGSVTVFSLCMVGHMRRHSEKMIPTIDAYRDEKQNHYPNTRTFDKSN